METRREAFRKECFKYADVCDEEMLTNFFNYWSDDSKKNGLMLWEMEKTWRLENRLKRWMKNAYAASDAAAMIRLERAKGKTTQP